MEREGFWGCQCITFTLELVCAITHGKEGWERLVRARCPQRRERIAAIGAACCERDGSQVAASRASLFAGSWLLRLYLVSSRLPGRRH